jgi:hypothetical protein
MDSSYRVFDGIGKLWQRGGKDEDKLSMFEEVKNQVKDRVKKVNDIPAKDNSSELKDIASTSTHREWDSVLPSFMDRVSRVDY